jgi:hypothetical protein
MDNLNYRGANFCTTNSLLTATGAETVHDTTVLLNYAINGKAYTKSGTNADQTTPTTDYNTSAAFPTLTGVASGGGQGAVVVWAYNSSGTVQCMMGPVETLDASGNFARAPQFPLVPDDVCAFAYQVLKHYGQGTSVTFGTSNWNTSGFTNAIVNVLSLPSRPQIS